MKRVVVGVLLAGLCWAVSAQEGEGEGENPLTGTATIVCNVRSIAFDKAIFNAVLTLSPLGVQLQDNLLGVYTFNNVPAGRYDLIVSALSHVTKTVDVRVREGQLKLMKVELELVPMEIPDADGDDLLDADELTLGTNPIWPDSDLDGMPD
ncbi:MAG: CarboxypepD reg-like domain, partial [Candidatus Hydrogenedentes bacterium]|nr:CarboxypepD reg-like domain [Candidatus Hydrogenedentota bacterium]